MRRLRNSFCVLLVLVLLVGFVVAYSYDEIKDIETRKDMQTDDSFMGRQANEMMLDTFNGNMMRKLVGKSNPFTYDSPKTAALFERIRAVEGTEMEKIEQVYMIVSEAVPEYSENYQHPATEDLTFEQMLTEGHAICREKAALLNAGLQEVGVDSTTVAGSAHAWVRVNSLSSSDDGSIADPSDVSFDYDTSFDLDTTWWTKQFIMLYPRGSGEYGSIREFEGGDEIVEEDVPEVLEDVEEVVDDRSPTGGIDDYDPDFEFGEGIKGAGELGVKITGERVLPQIWIGWLPDRCSCSRQKEFDPSGLTSISLGEMVCKNCPEFFNLGSVINVHDGGILWLNVRGLTVDDFKEVLDYVSAWDDWSGREKAPDNEAMIRALNNYPGVMRVSDLPMSFYME